MITATSRILSLVVKTEVLLAEVRQRVPELPKAKRGRFVQQYQVSPYDAAVLANDLDLARYFEAAAKGAKKAKNVANWILNDLQNALSSAGKTINDCPIPPETFDELVNLIDGGKNQRQARQRRLRGDVCERKKRARDCERKGDRATKRFKRHRKVMRRSNRREPQAGRRFQSRYISSLNFLKGQVIRLSKGKLIRNW